MKRLNNKGISHLLVPLLVVVAVGIVGTYLLVSSHADSVTPASTSATEDMGALSSETEFNWPNADSIPTAVLSNDGAVASASSSKDKVTKKQIKIIGKKDLGLCPVESKATGCRKGFAGYHKIETSKDTLWVVSNMEGRCYTKGTQSFPVKTKDAVVYPVGNIHSGAKIKCTFKKGQVYDFKLRSAQGMKYWGSSKKTMHALGWDRTDGNKSLRTGKKATQIILGSNK